MAVVACKALYNLLLDEPDSGTETNCREMWKPSPEDILDDSFDLLVQTLEELLEMYADDDDDEPDETCAAFIQVGTPLIELLKACSRHPLIESDMIPLDVEEELS
jgi:hypothetical protein